MHAATTAQLTTTSPVHGTSPTLTWTAALPNASVAGYWLQIGTSQGTNTLDDTGGLMLPGASSKQVSGLPANTTSVWVRLWTKWTSTAWSYQDTQLLSAP